ncbi:unnamed protein product, partial [Mesorhabditis belari]|uniref:E3 ubiquitin-protein ligase UBR5 n=1 Tax=Mesorhabditis belari TaxID=2138241 RepID=A0AAF3EXA6_9BILA
MTEEMDESTSAVKSTPELFMIKYDLGAKDNEISDIFKSTSLRRNTGDRGCRTIPALEVLNLSIEDYEKIVVGPAHIVFLLKDGRVFRLGFCTKNRSVSPTRTVPVAATSHAAPPPFAARHPKYRRVMLSSSRRDRGGVIVDRARPMLPASEVPEDLIAQAQVVLQGKSREMIVRELQRTNLNVNEAVNNLLSKDDDEDEEEGGPEVCIPEELLTLLDAHQDLESAFMISRANRRRDNNGDKKEKKESASYEEFLFDNEVDFWQSGDEITEDHQMKFTDITACATELIGLADGKVYGWKWSEGSGSTQPHERAVAVTGGASIVKITSSYLRVAVLYEKPSREGMIREIASWMDPQLLPGKVGMELSQSFPPQPFSIDRKAQGGDVNFFCSDLFAGFVTQNGYIHWSGIVPSAEKVHNFGKTRSKTRKQWSQEGPADNEIHVGAEVRPKTAPLYEAGSVAVLLKDGVPKVGVLMEKVWSATETCRFRIVDKESYDLDFKDIGKEQTIVTEMVGDTRKRRANESESQTQEPWPVNDAVFIYEQPHENVWIVVIHDKDSKQCVVVNPRESPWIDIPRSELSVSHPRFHESKLQIRQVCQLQVRPSSIEPAQFYDSPKCIEPLRLSVRIPISYDILCSVVADEKGIRCLLCTDGVYNIVRVSVNGRVLSKHSLPFSSTSVIEGQKKLTTEELPHQPSLVNFSKDEALFIRSKPKSSMLALMRDSEGGFGALASFHQPLCFLQSLWIDPGSGSSDKKTGSVIIFGLSPPTEGNLFQAVLDCDVEAVKRELEVLAAASETKCREIFGIYSTKKDNESPVFNDVGGNILHAAVLLSTSATNRDQADKSDEGAGTKSPKSLMDQKWSRFLRSSTTEKRVQQLQALGIPKDKDTILDTTDAGIKFLSDAKQRQTNALEIVKLLVDFPSNGLFANILKQKDCNGLNPYSCAVENRAYSAAKSIWESAVRREIDLNILLEPPPNWFSLPEHNKSWALFVLSYNDTCSFTWTGQDHINQDIFECRTCGLTGTLCCCTECAFTCHRGHDCSLKRTSPTAYCDCWEKCPCKALVSGNQDARMWLLKELLKKTDCFAFPNPSGCHIIYFLARTVARQTTEQIPYKKRIPKANDGESDSNVPEQNLEPPNFATKALEVCLGSLDVVQHFVTEVVNDNFEANELNDIESVAWSQRLRSEQLDVTLFLLLTKCPVDYINTLVDTLQKGLDLKHDEVATVVCRIVRSILRIYVLLCTLSTTAAMVAANGLFSKKQFPVVFEEKKDDRLTVINYRRLMTGAKPQEVKPEIIIDAMTRCHNVLKAFQSFTSLESARMAAATIGPLLVGRARTIVPMNNKLKESEVFNQIESTLMRRTVTKTRTLDSPQKDPYREEETESEETDDEMDTDRNTLPSSNRLLSTSSNLPVDDRAPEEEAPRTSGLTRHSIVLNTSRRDGSANSYSSDDDSENEDENEDHEHNEEDDPEEIEEDGEPLDDMEILDFDALVQARNERDSRSSDDSVGQPRGDPPALNRGQDDQRNENSNDSNTNQATVNQDDEQIMREETERRRRERRARYRRHYTSRIHHEPVITSHTVEATTDDRRRPPAAPGDATNVEIEKRDKNETKELLTNNADSVRHLCSAFYVLSRIAFEVELLNSSNSLNDNSMKYIEECLAPAWNWLRTVMDVTEAKIKLAKHRREDVEIQPESAPKHLNEVPTVSSYLIDLMRGASGEQGDRPPTLDSNLLRPLTLVADAFLIRCRSLDSLRSSLHGTNEQQKIRTTFFERSFDYCYPGIIQKENNSIFDDPLNLSTNPFLLMPDFARPDFYEHESAKMTREEWKKFYEERMNLEIVDSGGQTRESICLAGRSESDDYWSLKRGLVVKQDLVMSEEPIARSPTDMDADSTLRLLEVRSESRWRYTLECLARNYHDDIFSICGHEVHKSLLITGHASYNARAQFFNQKIFDHPGQASCKELVLEKLSRSHDKLVKDTVFQLNAQFTKRANQKGTIPPLFTHKVKVGFENEPGEGSGVARAFYSALAESLISLQKLPFDDLGWENSEEYLYGGAPPEASPQKTRGIIEYFSSTDRSSALDEQPSVARRLQLLPGRLQRSPKKTPTTRRQQLKLTSALYTSQTTPNVFGELSMIEGRNPPIDESSTIRQHLGLADRIYAMVAQQHTRGVERIVGLLVDLPVSIGIQMNMFKEIFKQYLQDAIDLLQKSGDALDKAIFDKGEQETTETPVVQRYDTAPLFYQVSAEQKVFTPCPGNLSPIRLSAFRNVGRVIGLCLVQQHVFPLHLPRHVWKSILDRPHSFHDLAFVDKELYTRLRDLIIDLKDVEVSTKKLEEIDLYFSCAIPKEEGDGISPQEVELCPGGKDIRVTRANLLEYVHELVKHRLHRGELTQCYQSIRQGINDAIPPGFMDHLSPEDLVLLVNGVAEINLERLKKLTNFQEECRISEVEINKLSRWFWETVDKFTDKEKQELVFFWTGSATLPALDEMFVPRPTVVIRSLSDAHLPSANTCISRIYLPQYSSKKILASKLRSAIQLSQMSHVIGVLALCTATAFADQPNQPRTVRSANVLVDDTSNVIKDIINSVHPIVLVVIGLLIAAGCAFELAYGSRGSAGRTVTHVASRNNIKNAVTVAA